MTFPLFFPPKIGKNRTIRLIYNLLQTDKYFLRYFELKWPKNSIFENMAWRKKSGYELGL